VRRQLVVTVLVAALLSGCAGAGPAPKVQVTDDAGTAPALVYTTPLAVTRASSTVIRPGSGPRLVDGGPLLLNYRLQKAQDATLVKETYSKVPTAFTMTPETLSQDLYDALSGESVGARVLLLVPATSNTSSFASVMVVDVLATRAAGQPVPPRPGLPVVTLGGDGEPNIAAPTGDPPSQGLVQDLIKGDGARVEKGATVTVQYSGVRWSDGSTYDSTWAKGGPRSFDLRAGVLPGLAAGLVDRTVGSQVMLVIPPSGGGTVGSENDTLVLVVDVLATSNPSDRAKAPTPGAARPPTGPAG
jgi:peptidylprolyl isomerase